ncbi:winged helix-turn-helix transcriptional regulator [Aminobacter aganoensis]|uniref:DNA-binding HxlR family transcriptional regulator n=1 Tax=Aminobacter aganoensis TaxID=83264 RepID=A0A7X0FA03_9HYPH|nr:MULTISPECIES: helix-turn-helix domain-containing protein [Aminobacter]MBB6355643.1 DNA-binding HxlR family transcriptional regulator [Aminobacter aganoensis]
MTATSEREVPMPRRPEVCPVEDWLSFLGHRWNALVLWQLSAGPKRHGDLMARLPGITAKVLSERLDGLSRRGLVERDAVAAFPRGVVYSLTSGGRQVVAILDQFETLPQSFARLDAAL